jgi:two-component system OmpR family response regulator
MNTARKKILVVDDEPSITRLLKVNLEATGDYLVRGENNALHAITAALEFQPDLILLDVLMPGMDGGELAARLQASARLGKVPVIFLTAVATKQDVSSHDDGLIGGLPFLAKPVDMPEVVAALRKHLAA